MMAGIGDMVKGGAQMPAPTAETPANPPSEGGAQSESNVTPEEQAQYEMVMRNALKIIYPEGEEAQISPQVLQALKGSENPQMNLATAAVTLVTQLRDSAKKAGQPISDDVLYHAGSDIVGELAEVAEATKIYDFSEEEIENAWYMALDMYRAAGEQSGDVDSAQLKQSFEELRAADKEGRLDELMPGVSERMKGQKGAQ
jgi:hypothetical protein